MKIEGVIFDLDGTLVHTIEDIVDAANMMLQQNGFKEHSTDDYLSWIGNGAAKLIEKALGSGCPEGKLNLFVTEFKDIYSRNLSNKSHLYDGISELLDELTSLGLKLSILSNKPHLLTKKVVDYYLSAWELSPVFGQRKEVPRKPDPAAANEIAELLKLNKSNTLFVGDSIGDIRTGEAAGMIPVGVTWGYGRLGNDSGDGSEKSYHTITHPQELLTLLY